MFGVSNSLIRYWETEFKVLKPAKNKKGDRRFMVKDIRTLEKIYTLVKERGFTLEGAKKELKAKSKSDTTKEVIQKLKKMKQDLGNLKHKVLVDKAKITVDKKFGDAAVN